MTTTRQEPTATTVWTEVVGQNGRHYLVDLSTAETRTMVGQSGEWVHARRWIKARNDFAKTVTTAVLLSAVTPV